MKKQLLTKAELEAKEAQAKAKRKIYRREYRKKLMAERGDEIRARWRERARGVERAWRSPWTRKWIKKQMAENPVFKMTQLERSRIRCAVKSKGTTKRAHTMDLLGCTSTELKTHLEKQFLPGMSWGESWTLWLAY